MSFAQLTYRESLRDIQECLRAAGQKLYHMGIRGPIRRSTLADANENRNWLIYADFAQILIQTARDLYANEPFAVELTHTAYAFDATVIQLCLSLFPWSHFRQKQGAVKLHTLMDLRGNIPSVIHITSAKTQEVTLLDELIPEPGSFYILDRGYLDLSRLYRLHQCLAFFVIRQKVNLNFNLRLNN